MHGYRWRKYGTLTPPDGRKTHPKVACRGGGCTASVSAHRQQGTGLCKRCFRRKWYIDHREHERRSTAEWHAKNVEHKREYTRTYHEANSEQIRARHARNYYVDHEATLERRQQWRAANTERIREQERLRRRADPTWPLRNRENARRRAKAPDGAKVDYAAIIAQHGMVCHICGSPIAGRTDLHFDHVVPLARGGLHSADNIRPAHARCNLRKGARVN